VAKRTLTRLPLVEPIIPVARGVPFDDPSWLFEPKYDGFRGLLYDTREGCHYRSKRGNILKRFQELCYWVREELAVKEALLDGEVVALDPEGRQASARWSPAGESALRGVRRALDQREGSAEPSTHPTQARAQPSDLGNDHGGVPGLLG
jgi:hypothetical protein